jgi:hypothetical protein
MIKTSMKHALLLSLIVIGLAQPLIAATPQVLIEAESFDSHGGWKLDTQSIESTLERRRTARPVSGKRGQHTA